MRHSFAVALLLSLLVTPAFAATRNWTGTTSGVWSDPSNWGGTAPVAGDDLVFAVANNANALTNDYPAGTSFQSLAFYAATTFNVSGNRIVLTNSLVQSLGVIVNDFMPITLGATQTWFLGSSGGQLVLNGSATLDLGANTLTLVGFGSHSFSGNAITGTGGLTVSDNVTLTVTGQMNYTGTTTVASITIGPSPTLILSTPNAIASPIVVNNGGHLTDAVGFSGFMNAPLTIGGGGFYDVTINGPALLQYSTVTVNNSPITLGGTLTVTNNVVSAPGTVFTIINNQTGSAVVGTFAGLPEGATFTSGGQTFKISYIGGDGNDVTLTTQGALTPTTTSLASSVNPSTIGQSVTFTATVSPAATGSVSFFDGATPLGTVSLDGSSQAALATSSLSAGTHNIVAVYAGDSTHAGSSSAVLVQNVNLQSATITVTSSPNPSFTSDPVTFTATVTPGTTGNVTFFDGSTQLGTAALNGSSQASLTTSSLSAGPHSISATYGGDNTHFGAASPPITQVVVVSPAIPTLDPGALAAMAVMLAAVAAVVLARR
jgi:hypothetical protein